MRFFGLAIIAIGIGLFVVLQNSGISAQSTNKGSTTMSKEIQMVEDFIDAFNAKDVDAIMAFFSDDPIYHNMPSGPVTGTGPVRDLITSFVSPASSIDWEMLHIAQTGDTVLTERMDRFVLGGKNVELPVMGAFDIKDGKITAWRDYFDMATWTKQMAN